MTNELSLEEKCRHLDELAVAAIERLKQLPQPVVRVSGPLTSGGYGYSENEQRFIVAQQKLREQGYTVFDYFEGNNDEAVIKSLNFGDDWPLVMEHYHYPIMATGLIGTVFMMPRWRESHGATGEHAFAMAHGLKIRPVPADWFLPAE